VRYGTGYLPYLISPEQLRERVGRLKEIADEAGRPFSEITIACTTFLIPAESKARAIEIGHPRVGFNFVTPENMGRYYVLGSAAECVDKIGEYLDAGATHVVLGCHGGQERQLERFIECTAEILPTLRSLQAGAERYESA